LIISIRCLELGRQVKCRTWGDHNVDQQQTRFGVEDCHIGHFASGYMNERIGQSVNQSINSLFVRSLTCLLLPFCLLSLSVCPSVCQSACLLVCLRVAVALPSFSDKKYIIAFINLRCGSPQSNVRRIREELLNICVRSDAFVGKLALSLAASLGASLKSPRSASNPSSFRVRFYLALRCRVRTASTLAHCYLA